MIKRILKINNKWMKGSYEPILGFKVKHILLIVLFQQLLRTGFLAELPDRLANVLL